MQKKIENWSRFDKVTESLKVGTFLETQCTNAVIFLLTYHRGAYLSYLQKIKVVSHFVPLWCDRVEFFYALSCSTQSPA